MATRLQVQYVPDSAKLDTSFLVRAVHRDLTPGKTYSARAVLSSGNETRTDCTLRTTTSCG